MAQYKVTHSCGHEIEHQLYGPGKERERKIEWLGRVECEDCKRQAEREKAAAFTAASNLPELTGSEKQIAWANTIRAKILGELDTIMAHGAAIIAAGQADAADPKVIATQKAYRVIGRQADASWWIDRRDRQPIDLLRSITKLVLDKIAEKQTS